MTDPMSPEYAARLDDADPLADFRAQFVGAASPLVYFDGNSLGRPLKATVMRLGVFAEREWGDRLIRAWDEEWMELPIDVGNELGTLLLGAAPGQTFVGDSTTVLLYKLVRAGVDARPGRSEIVIDDDNFPTDRYIVEGVAAERGLTVRWIETDRSAGVSAEQLAAAVGPQTALVVLSHVAYRSAHLADVPTLTSVVHDAGGLILWDLCHSAGSVPVELDAWEVDLAVGCTYKYLNGGPGSPAFGYVAARHHDTLTQPIQGWMGHADPFLMGPGYRPASGIRRFISGTPPILAMQPLRDMLGLIEEAGIAAVCKKSQALTEYAIELHDAVLAPLGVQLASPRDPEVRGGHVTLRHPAMRQVTAALWERDVIPDYRDPDGLRIGLSPLSTSFDEVRRGIEAVREELQSVGAAAGGAK